MKPNLHNVKQIINHLNQVRPYILTSDKSLVNELDEITLLLAKNYPTTTTRAFDRLLILTEKLLYVKLPDEVKVSPEYSVKSPFKTECEDYFKLDKIWISDRYKLKGKWQYFLRNHDNEPGLQEYLYIGIGMFYDWILENSILINYLKYKQESLNVYVPIVEDFDVGIVEVNSETTPIIIDKMNCFKHGLAGQTDVFLNECDAIEHVNIIKRHKIDQLLTELIDLNKPVMVTKYDKMFI